MYELLAVPFLVFRDPRWGMAWVHLLCAAGAWLLDRSIKRSGAPASLRLAFITLETWGLSHAPADQHLLERRPLPLLDARPHLRDPAQRGTEG